MIPINEIVCGNALDVLKGWPDGTIDCCVTSPPYWGLRDYGTATWEGGDMDCDHSLPMDAPNSAKMTEGQQTSHAGRFANKPCRKCGAIRIDQQLGLEKTPEEYVAKMVEIFREVKRVLKDDATLWLNLGSSYASCDIQPNRFRAGVPACDNDDKEFLNSQDDGRVYSDYDGALQDENQNHPGCNAHNGLSYPQDVLQKKQKDHDKEHLGFDQASLDVSSRGVLQSTIFSSSKNVSDVSCPEDGALACPQELQTSSGDVPVCVGTKACISCTAGTLRPSSHHKSDKEFFSETFQTPNKKDNPALTSLYCTIAAGGFKQKDEINLPFFVAEALRLDGWYLRQTIIWSKSNPMPESVTDRTTKSHEYIFLLTKKPRYWYDADAIREPHKENSLKRIEYGLKHRHPDNIGVGIPPVDTDRMGERFCHPAGRNKRSVWTVPTQSFSEAHFATFPPKLIEPCILAGCPERVCKKCGKARVRIVEREELKRNKLDCGNMDNRGVTRTTAGLATAAKTGFAKSKTTGWTDCGCGEGFEPGIVLDPFMGSGTTGMVAYENRRNYVGIELSEEYIKMDRAEKAKKKYGLFEE